MVQDTKAKIAQALRLLADAIEAETPAVAEWVTQSQSPLGRVRHCQACKRRVANGEGGARIIGRRHELSAEALQAELQAVSRRRIPCPKKPGPSSVIDELRAELKLVGGGRT
jgi:hypothetical protein